MRSESFSRVRWPALAAFAADLDPASLPAEVRRTLGWLLLDYLRVCSIGARLPWSDWARGYVGLVGKAGASHVLFSPDTLNPQHATFMNVTFGSSFDGDDTHVGAMLHPGVAAWSAALATAEHVGASGSEMLAAVVAGYETIIRIGLSMQPGHFRRGFQSTGTCDVFGTAAAAGRLLFRGADAERKIDDVTAYTRSSQEFHLAVAEASHNRVLVVQLISLQHVSWPARNPTLTPKVSRRILETHKELASLIEMRDVAECAAPRAGAVSS